jgi:hypothetical protein
MLLRISALTGAEGLMLDREAEAHPTVVRESAIADRTQPLIGAMPDRAARSVRKGIDLSYTPVCGVRREWRTTGVRET